MAGARAVGAAGRGWGSSYAGSVGRHSCVRVGTRCPPPAVRGGPVARGVRGRALSPLRLPSSGGLSGPAAHVLWARVCGYGVQRCPRGPYSLCSSGAGSRGFAARVSVVRRVCGQALPLPRLSALWAGCWVRHPILLWARVCGCGGPALSPRVACPVGAALRGGGGGRLRGGGPPSLRGASGVRRCPSPFARPLGRPSGSATHMLWARACGCGGPALSPRPACPVGAACRGDGGWSPPGRVVATVARVIWCQTLSLPQPPALWGG